MNDAGEAREEWLNLVQAIGEFGSGGRIIVIAKQGSDFKAVETHQLVPEAAGYARGSTWKYRQQGWYSLVFAGIRLFYDKERNMYVPTDTGRSRE